MLLSMKSCRNTSSYLGMAVGRTTFIFYLTSDALKWLHGHHVLRALLVGVFHSWSDSLVTASWRSAISDSSKSTGKGKSMYWLLYDAKMNLIRIFQCVKAQLWGKITLSRTHKGTKLLSTWYKKKLLQSILYEYITRIKLHPCAKS